MGEEIAFRGFVTLTLTLDRVILHTIMHHLSTFTYVPNVIEIEETFCGRTDGRTDERTFETHFIRSTRRSRPKNRIAQKKRSWQLFYVIELLVHFYNCDKLRLTHGNTRRLCGGYCIICTI